MSEARQSVIMNLLHSTQRRRVSARDPVIALTVPMVLMVLMVLLVIPDLADHQVSNVGAEH